jgi:hypothetical protein
VIEPKFDAAMRFNEGRARVLMGDRWGYIDHGGGFLLPPTFGDARDFHEGLAQAAPEKKGPFGYINTQGEFVIQPAYRYATPFSEGLAAASPLGQTPSIFLNRDGDQAFAGEYLSTGAFSDGLCRVATLKTIAYIDHQGKTVWEGPYVDRP